MGCGTTTVKVSSVVFNIVLALLSIGAIVWIAIKPVTEREEITIAAYVACALIILFALFGIFAAIKESICLAATCAVFLLLLALLQIALTVIVMNDHEATNGIAEVNRKWDQNNMDQLQINHECCGKDSSQDYIHIGKIIPSSCYFNQDNSHAAGLFINGCSKKLQDFYDSEKTRFAIVSGLLIAFEILGCLLAIFLVINFRNKQRRMQF